MRFRRGSGPPPTRDRIDTTDYDSEVTCREAIAEASCSELFSIIACGLCVLLTFTIAFFMPEIGSHIASTLPMAMDDDYRKGHDRHPHPIENRGALSEFNQWRNDSHRGCVAGCLSRGVGSVFVLPLDDAWPSAVDLVTKQPLVEIARREVCDRQRDDAQASAHQFYPSVFVNPPGSPFDLRLFRHSGVAFVAEFRDPVTSMLTRAQREHDLGKRPKQSRLKGTAAGVGTMPRDVSNPATRTLANVPRPRHADRQTATIRRAKKVLGSFDLVLVGAWERDPEQRRRLLSLLRGRDRVGALSDFEVKAALGLGQSEAKDEPFRLPTEADRKAAAAPIPKVSKSERLKTEKEAKELGLHIPPREMLDIDLRVYYAAMNLPNAAIRPLPQADTSAHSCRLLAAAARGHECALSGTGKAPKTGFPRFLTGRTYCGGSIDHHRGPVAPNPEAVARAAAAQTAGDQAASLGSRHAATDDSGGADGADGVGGGGGGRGVDFFEEASREAAAHSSGNKAASVNLLAVLTNQPKHKLVAASFNPS